MKALCQISFRMNYTRGSCLSKEVMDKDPDQHSDLLDLEHSFCNQQQDLPGLAEPAPRKHVQQDEPSAEAMKDAPGKRCDKALDKFPVDQFSAAGPVKVAETRCFQSDFLWAIEFASLSNQPSTRRGLPARQSRRSKAGSSDTSWPLDTYSFSHTALPRCWCPPSWAPCPRRGSVRCCALTQRTPLEPPRR